jgi:hypothetical protein
MAFVHLGCILPLMMTFVIALSVCICSGVGGCLWPNSSRMILMYTALRAMMWSPARSALVADNMRFFMMCAMFNAAPLFGGMVVSLDRKNVPQLCCMLWVHSSSLCCCVLLIPYHWCDKRVLHPPVWLDNRGVEEFAAFYLWSVLTIGMQWH